MNANIYPVVEDENGYIAHALANYHPGNDAPGSASITINELQPIAKGAKALKPNGCLKTEMRALDCSPIKIRYTEQKMHIVSYFHELEEYT